MSSTGVGCAGAHRTGKTTLAQAFALRSDIPFVRTSASEVFELLGKDPKADYCIESRIVIQEAILYAFERQYAHAAGQSAVWVSDRTPIDLASYMLADVQRATLAGQPELAQYVVNYVKRCIESTNKWFATVVLVQPGIPLVEAVGKAGACAANIEHINLIQAGLLLSENLSCGHYMIPRQFTLLEDRLQALGQAALCTINRGQQIVQFRQDNNLALH